MFFLKLTDRHEGEIHINMDQVGRMKRDGDSTILYFQMITGSFPDGKQGSISQKTTRVTETPEHIVKQLPQ